MRDLDIAGVFNRCFERDERTVLVGGADEPLYLPASTTAPAQLFYREDFAASALHEAAHWCIAGPGRRRLVDFGYAYTPPPRSAQQQQAFFAAELRTQTLESIFASAAGLEFRPSADNLEAALEAFSARVVAQRPSMQRWMQASVDTRATRFAAALAEARRGTGTAWTA